MKGAPKCRCRTPRLARSGRSFPFSITLVEYMIGEYGYEKIIAIIKAPSEVEATLGITIPELDSAWREYLRETYP